MLHLSGPESSKNDEPRPIAGGPSSLRGHLTCRKALNITLDENVNQGCHFTDMGGITIGDDVKIGPKVNLISAGHPSSPADRKRIVAKPITIGRNVWIGATATILPGVTVGVNAVVAAGAVVSRPEKSTVAGVPARVV